VDQAGCAGGIDPKNPSLVELVRQKLAVPGNHAVDVSEKKRGDLQWQLEKRLKPVLREVDFANFDLNRAFEAVCRFAEPVL
jgi:hypothetical protein